MYSIFNVLTCNLVNSYSNIIWFPFSPIEFLNASKVSNSTQNFWNATILTTCELLWSHYSIAFQHLQFLFPHVGLHNSLLTQLPFNIYIFSITLSFQPVWLSHLMWVSIHITCEISQSQSTWCLCSQISFASTLNN